MDDYSKVYLIRKFAAVWTSTVEQKEKPNRVSMERQQKWLQRFPENATSALALLT